MPSNRRTEFAPFMLDWECSSMRLGSGLLLGMELDPQAAE
jgi:hypothetical protein